MPLVIVNPTKRPPKPARKARKKGEPPMATKRHRSAAQKRAFANMIAHNPRRRRRVTNPSNPRRRRVAVSRHRVIHRRRPPMFGRRRRRNPAEKSGMFGQLVSAQALMMIAGIAITPTIVTLAQTTLLPNATGYYAAGFQGVVGVGLGWAVYQVDRAVGQMIALVGIANAIATFVANYQAGGTSTLSGYPTFKGARQLGAYRDPRGKLTMMGYVPSSGQNGGNLNGYGTMQGAGQVSRMAAMNPASREPGVYYM